MKIIFFALLLFFTSVSAQKKAVLIAENLPETKDFFADDYGNFYFYRSADFSLMKYDSIGKLSAQLRLTFPFKIQSVQNPLNIPSFSENAQEMKFFDKNLAEIQTVKFQQKFGFIKAAYAEDLQQIWLLDASSRNLIQYHFRDDKVLNKFPLNFDFDEILDMIVYDKKLYLLFKNKLEIYNFKSEKLAEITAKNSRKLRRENDQILVIGQNAVSQISGNQQDILFQCDDCEIVDKNTSSYFAISNNKLYLYPLEK
ncbi:hypothetical protein SAMN05421638_0302 [Kaistella treverensis]|uniref:Uncharacterized protein n=1 Tax=Kaistella treverensis TaxID=631455 RepID=A0A1I3JPI1_9FLAO|nr:hypothetical protein [Kaistella treverensis]SFI62064.1 hypothetical protein SAMN05421638_0302 [Kaistella treverensis]